jgi:hypothetical protein
MIALSVELLDPRCRGEDSVEQNRLINHSIYFRRSRKSREVRKLMRLSWLIS